MAEHNTFMFIQWTSHSLPTPKCNTEPLDKVTQLLGCIFPVFVVEIGFMYVP